MSRSDQQDRHELSPESNSEDPLFTEGNSAIDLLRQEIEAGRSRGDGGANRRRFSVFRLFRRMLLLFFLLVTALIIAIAASAYYGRYWIKNKFEERLQAELNRQHIYLGYGSTSYHFTRGLVLQDVKLYETEKREKLLITCSEIGFTMDMVDFAQNEFQGNVSTAFTTHDAEIVCFENGQEVATLTNLRAEIYGKENSVVVDRFAGRIGDLDFDFDGMIMVSREDRRKAQDRKNREGKDGLGDTRKVADFAFFKGVMPWLAVTGRGDGPQPEIRGHFVVDPDSENPVTVEGRFLGRNFQWREVPLDSAIVEFSFAEGDRRLTLPDFNLIYEGGLISGEAIWDSGTGSVDVKRFQSSADILGLLRRINPTIAPFAASVQQSEPPVTKATGRLELKDFWASDLDIDYRQPGGVTLLLNRGDFRLEQIVGLVKVKDGQLHAKSLNMRALGGNISASGTAVFSGNSGPRYQGRLEVRALPLQEIVNYAGGDAELPGLLSLDFEGSGGVEMVALNGKGGVRLDAAKLYKVPVVGPIQNFMGAVVPVFGDDKRSEMTASFTIDRGVLSSDDLVVRSDGTRVTVVGQVDLSNMQTNFEAEGNMVGALGLVTGLVSKALVVEGSGRVDDLNLNMKNMPAEFASDTVKGIFGVAGQGLEGTKNLAGGALKATGSVIGGGADMVKEIGKGNVGDGVRAVGETGMKGIEGGAKLMGEGAKRIGQGLLRIIPGGQQQAQKENPPVVIDPEKPAELEIVKEGEPEEPASSRKKGNPLRSLAPIFSDR